MYYITGYLKGCQIWPLHKVRPMTQRQFENKIYLNYINMTKLSCDIKYIYRASRGQRFILVFTDEVISSLVTILLYRGNSHENI